jgi:hypothetical protein
VSLQTIRRYCGLCENEFEEPRNLPLKLQGFCPYCNPVKSKGWVLPEDIQVADGVHIRRTRKYANKEQDQQRLW